MLHTNYRIRNGIQLTLRTDLPDFDWLAVRIMSAGYSLSMLIRFLAALIGPRFILEPICAARVVEPARSPEYRAQVLDRVLSRHLHPSKG